MSPLILMVLGNSFSRWRNHASLAFVSAAIYAFVHVITNETFIDQLSIATAYICLLLITVALSIGPLQLLQSGKVVTNIYLRRDVGIWAAVTGLVHCVIATKLSMTPEYISAYVDISSAILSESIRATLFLWGSVAAFVIAVLLLVLLCLSNQRVLNLLGVKWWKRLQRLAYLALALTIVHGLAFQLIESRSLIFIGLVLFAFLQVVILQSLGIALMRRKRLH